MTTTDQGSLFMKILGPEHRAHPEVVWQQLRREPVSRQDDGTWVVTGYSAVRALMSDPRLSSDKTKAGPDVTVHAPPVPEGGPSIGFLDMDAPDHDRVRRSVMSHFGPPTSPRFVLDLGAEISRLTAEALDAMPPEPARMDVVEDFAYPLPVSIIMSLLGIPPEDADQVRRWFEIITDGDLQSDPTPENIARFAQTVGDALGYTAALANRRRTDPGDDLVSGLATDRNGLGPMSDVDIAGTGLLLLGAGHETTVNSVASAVLTLLRHPAQLALVREHPELVPGAFEEVLRLEPPVPFRDRHTLAEVTVDGVTIPRGVTVQLSLAAANRDPARFTDPDAFDVRRPDNQHLSFLGGAHYCFGAPLARLEARLMLTEWVRRVRSPRLVVDPPPYRGSSSLRGPRHLLVDHDGVAR